MVASLNRFDIEHGEKWREIMAEVPFIQFPDDWQIKPIPPFSGAVARFLVKLPSGTQKSVYLDWYDRLGCVGQPYWEVHPYHGDCGRALLSEIDELLKLIADESDGENFVTPLKARG